MIRLRCSSQRQARIEPTQACPVLGHGFFNSTCFGSMRTWSNPIFSGSGHKLAAVYYFSSVHLSVCGARASLAPCPPFISSSFHMPPSYNFGPTHNSVNSYPSYIPFLTTSPPHLHTHFLIHKKNTRSSPYRGWWCRTRRRVTPSIGVPSATFNSVPRATSPVISTRPQDMVANPHLAPYAINH